MTAIRQIQQVKSGTITVCLPADFHDKQVEIIILPIEETGSTTQDLQNLLLAAPTITDEEVRDYETVWEWMSQWNVNDF